MGLDTSGSASALGVRLDRRPRRPQHCRVRHLAPALVLLLAAAASPGTPARADVGAAAGRPDRPARAGVGLQARHRWHVAVSVGVHGSVRHDAGMWQQLHRAWYEEPEAGAGVALHLGRRAGDWVDLGVAVGWQRFAVDRKVDARRAVLDRLAVEGVGGPSIAVRDDGFSRTELGVEAAIGWVHEWWRVRSVAETADALRLRGGPFMRQQLGDWELGPTLTFARTYLGRVGPLSLSADQTSILFELRLGVRW